MYVCYNRLNNYSESYSKQNRYSDILFANKCRSLAMDIDY